MMKRLCPIFFFLLLVSSQNILAKESPRIGNSPEALLMGDAFTAVADDEYTLFYNPAALGRNKGVSFTPLNISIGGTNVLGDMDRFKNFPKKDPAGIADRIINYPVSLQASAFPGFKMAQLGFNLFLSSNTNMVLRNAIHPYLDVDYRYDRGFIMGYAYNLGSGASSSRIKKSARSKINSGQRASIGMAIKHMNRQGLAEKFDLFGTTLLNKINSGVSDVDSLKTALGYSEGKAWGVDIGAEVAYSAGRSLLTAGASILDVGGTQFNRVKGTGEIPKQEMTVNSGVAYKQDFGFFDYTLAVDLKPMTSNIDFGRKIHVGTALSFPVLTFYGGWSEGYVSYGTTIKFWPIKLTAGFYGVEVGTHYKEQEAKRFIVYVSLFDFSFDM